ncbi:MAG: malto-oligosyltrehalose synthase [Myxococcales bacterium]|nr:malto-oligosyltrehalose synthase [Myxococcales bacterium]
MTFAPIFTDVPRHPISTYRLQITPSFSFTDAAQLVPYLKELGVTDVYISPPFSAAPGSTHGYDVVDHNVVRDELGGPEGYDTLCRAAAEAGLGQLLDFVPNHMGIGPTNPWWNEVLENGPSSVYAPYFDVEWHPIKRELANRVLVPVLGDQYGDVLERGELKLTREGGAFFVKYWDHCFPIAPRQVPLLIGHRLDSLRAELGAADVNLQELESIITALEKLAPRDEVSPEAVAERAREKEVAKRRLHSLFESCPRIAAFVDENVAIYNGTPGDARSYDLLDQLLDAQAYRLAHWRVAGEEINYRRFFDINSLAAIRMEDERVFDDTHRLVFQLIRDGKVTGLRIDHPDGLYAPSAYFRRLQEELDGIYVVVEKILEGHEKMPASWQVDGTTGYEFLNAVNGLFVDGRNATAFSEIYQRFSGLTERWQDLVVDRKRRLMRSSMASEISMLSHRLNRLSESNRRTRDFTLSALTSALSDFVARMPIYRTYVEGKDAASIEQRDRQYIESTIRAAKRSSRELNRSLYDFLRSILLLENPTEESLEFVRKLQQVTGPVTAKAIEDTAFYVYNRLVALNEVGGDPQKFGVPVEEFHQHNLERLRDWPGSLNTTATHDTKRGEDVRLRIDALSEIPVEWEQHLLRWGQLAVSFKSDLDGEPAPDANDELLLYQTLIGTFPDDGRIDDDYRARIGQYLDKALKEAKVHSSWTNPDEAYEKATRDFADALLSSAPFLADFVPFAQRIAAAARISSLSQVALKVAAPGVPDVYQGCELWDLSLVDPDNRRPVDYAWRAKLLESLTRRLAEGPEARLALARELSEPNALVDGRAKLLLVREALRFRRDHGPLFLQGEYVPLAVEGPDAAHVIAFARQHDEERVVCIVPRLTLQLSNRGRGRGLAGVTARVRLPDGCRQTLVDVVTGRRHDAVDGALEVSAVWGDFPVGLLICTEKA